MVENSHAKKIKQQIQAMVNSEKELRSRVVRLRKQLTDLKKEHDELNENGEQKMNNDNSNKNATSNPLINGAI